MASIPFTRVALPNSADFIGVDVFQWSPLTFATSDVGEPIGMTGSVDRSVQVTGDFGDGGTLRIEGTLDGVNWAPLTDPQGNALDLSAAKIESISELVQQIRPRVTAGNASTSLTVRILTRR